MNYKVNKENDIDKFICSFRSENDLIQMNLKPEKGLQLFSDLLRLDLINQLKFDLDCILDGFKEKNGISILLNTHFKNEKQTNLFQTTNKKKIIHFRSESLDFGNRSHVLLFIQKKKKIKFLILTFLKEFVINLLEDQILKTFSNEYSCILFIEKISSIIYKTIVLFHSKLETNNFLKIINSLNKFSKLLKENFDNQNYESSENSIKINETFSRLDFQTNILENRIENLIIKYQFQISKFFKQMVQRSKKQLDKNKFLKNPFFIENISDNEIQIEKNSIQENLKNDCKKEIICRLCLYKVYYCILKDHSKLCKKKKENDHSRKLLSQEGLNFFEILKNFERKIQQKMCLEKKSNQKKSSIKREESNSNSDDSLLSGTPNIMSPLNRENLIKTKYLPKKKSDFFNFHQSVTLNDETNDEDKSPIPCFESAKTLVLPKCQWENSPIKKKDKNLRQKVLSKNMEKNCFKLYDEIQMENVLNSPFIITKSEISGFDFRSPDSCEKIEDLRRSSSDFFEEKNIIKKKNMTTSIDFKDKSDDKKKSIRKLEIINSLISRIIFFFKEIINEEYSKSLELKLNHLINQTKNLFSNLIHEEIYKEDVIFFKKFLSFLNHYKINGHNYLKYSKKLKILHRGKVFSPKKKRETYGSTNKYKNSNNKFDSYKKITYYEQIEKKKIEDSKFEQLKLKPFFSQNLLQSNQSTQIEEHNLSGKVRTKTAPNFLIDRKKFKKEQITQLLTFKENILYPSDFSEDNNIKTNTKETIILNDSSSESSNHEEVNDMLKGYFSESSIINLNKNNLNQNNISFNDFEFITMINKGGYGRVWLVKRKNVEDLYAMKIVDTIDKINKNKLKCLRTESEIFDYVTSDFVVPALFKFTHETFICFVMEYMHGGDFANLLRKEQYFNEETAKFYISELILAVEYLHKMGIVHRDLKPDNILIDSKGHLKLTDFGLSDISITLKTFKHNENIIFNVVENKFKNLTKDILKMKGNLEGEELLKVNNGHLKENKDKKKIITKEVKNSVGRLGTPDYMAPEIVNETDIKCKNVDWWSVGVILFEFLTGFPPFNDETTDKIFDNINNLRIPWNDIQIGYNEGQMSPEAEDLIKKLLILDPEKRLGRHSINDIKNHPFFREINWNTIRTSHSPIIPDKFDKKELLKKFEKKNIINEKDNPFHTDKNKNIDNIETKNIIKNITTFQKVRFDLLYKENDKNYEEINSNESSHTFN